MTFLSIIVLIKAYSYLLELNIWFYIYIYKYVYVNYGHFYINSHFLSILLFSSIKKHFSTLTFFSFSTPFHHRDLYAFVILNIDFNIFLFFVRNESTI